MRAFVSLNPDAEALQTLEALMVRLQKAFQFAGAFPAWTPTSNLHFTMQFLGDEVADDAASLKQLTQTLDELAATVPPMEFNAESLGCFPTVNQPKTLWVGLHRRDVRVLEQLAMRVGGALRPLGYRPDPQPFQPHLTIARFKSMRGTHALPHLLQSQRAYARVQFRFQHLTLMQSDLSGKTPVYTVVHQAPLTGPGAQA